MMMMMMMMVINNIYGNFFFLSLLAMPPGKIEATLLSPLVFRVMQGAYFVSTEYFFFLSLLTTLLSITNQNTSM